MINFIKTLKEMGDELWRLVFVNSGVKLTIDDAGTLADIQDLEATGLTILVCGTCLDHFNLLERKQVGQTHQYAGHRHRHATGRQGDQHLSV